MKASLYLLIILFVAGCEETGQKDSSILRDPIFRQWTRTTPDQMLDLSSADYGTSSVTLTSSSGVCACQAVIQGDANSGTVETEYCNVTSGSNSNCTGAQNSGDDLEYNFATYGVRSQFDNGIYH
jgi:hypothetical protein